MAKAKLEEVKVDKTPESVNTNSEAKTAQTGPKAPAQKKAEMRGNTAVVSRSNHEVRRYDLATHGKKFAELANEFAAQHAGYTVEVITVEKHNAECPNCGHKFNYEK